MWFISTISAYFLAYRKIKHGKLFGDEEHLNINLFKYCIFLQITLRSLWVINYPIDDGCLLKMRNMVKKIIKYYESQFIYPFDSKLMHLIIIFNRFFLPVYEFHLVKLCENSSMHNDHVLFCDHLFMRREHKWHDYVITCI